MVTTYDEGTVCIATDSDASGRLTAYVTVTFPTCLSSSCDRVLSSSCQLALGHGTILVSAEAAVETSGTECTADCGFLTAECNIDVLPGTYAVQLGDEASNITLPTEATVFFDHLGGGAICVTVISD